MSERPIDVLLRANHRAGRSRREQAGTHGSAPRTPGVLGGAPDPPPVRTCCKPSKSRGGSYAPDHRGAWKPSTALAARVVAVAHQGVGLDAIHRAFSPAVVLAALQLIDAAGPAVMEGETR